MPYIICVNKPSSLPEQDPRAVATLEEAHEMALAEVETRVSDYDDVCQWQRLYREHAEAAYDVPEVGGIVGPMPDGYVIDVQAVTWAELATRAGISEWRTTARTTNGHDLARHERNGTRHTHDEILDAYNGV